MPPRTRKPDTPVPAVPVPDLPDPDRLTPYHDVPEDEGVYEYRSVTDITWGPHTFADHARLSQCELREVGLEHGTWTRSTFADVRLTDCRLAAPDLTGAHWRDTEFRRGLVSGAQFIGADLRRVHFEGAKLDSVNFRDAQLTDVVFTDCLLREADFAGAALTRVRFPGCVFEQAVFDRMRVSDVDLRGARVAVRSGWEALRGVVIDSLQLIELAPALAAHLGIKVVDGPAG